MVWLWRVACEAEQRALAPLFWPMQYQDHGPEPNTAQGVPAEHRLVADVGALSKDWPLAGPQAPSVGLATVQYARLAADVSSTTWPVDQSPM